jgi:hypothetical protein
MGQHIRITARVAPIVLFLPVTPVWYCRASLTPRTRSSAAGPKDIFPCAGESARYRGALQAGFASLLLVRIATFAGGCSNLPHANTSGVTITVTGPNNQTAAVPSPQYKNDGASAKY